MISIMSLATNIRWRIQKAESLIHDSARMAQSQEEIRTALEELEKLQTETGKEIQNLKNKEIK